ncbi:hypothetical protein ABEG18_24845 [Alsobacter sp. KACC 23698]|uniref:Uncharacterized protein n=1 Tax=Alsobacter sp. KACC 23698 TaxID=3149229 RepID=A0AAU7JFS6_9HYPH
MTFAPKTLPIVPASFFGIVLGLVGLGSAWRAATDGRASSERLMAETASSRFHELVDGRSVDWSFADVLI